jgi:hypothetical protein
VLTGAHRSAHSTAVKLTNQQSDCTTDRSPDCWTNCGTLRISDTSTNSDSNRRSDNFSDCISDGCPNSDTVRITNYRNSYRCPNRRPNHRTFCCTEQRANRLSNDCFPNRRPIGSPEYWSDC